jgi:hypothetical protein
MKFQRELFDYSCGYLTYGPERKFVARFKRKGAVGKCDFVRLLCKYYDVEQYMTRRYFEAPLEILIKDGYVKFDLQNHRVLVSK